MGTSPSSEAAAGADPVPGGGGGTPGDARSDGSASVGGSMGTSSESSMDILRRQRIQIRASHEQNEDTRPPRATKKTTSGTDEKKRHTPTC